MSVSNDSKLSTIQITEAQFNLLSSILSSLKIFDGLALAADPNLDYSVLTTGWNVTELVTRATEAASAGGLLPWADIGPDSKCSSYFVKDDTKNLKVPGHTVLYLQSSLNVFLRLRNSENSLNVAQDSREPRLFNVLFGSVISWILATRPNFFQRWNQLYVNNLPLLGKFVHNDIISVRLRAYIDFEGEFVEGNGLEMCFKFMEDHFFGLDAATS